VAKEGNFATLFQETDGIKIVGPNPNPVEGKAALDFEDGFCRASKERCWCFIAILPVSAHWAPFLSCS